MHAPDAEFIIAGFLQRFSAMGLTARVAARKSLIVVNMIHALLSKEPLFGCFGGEAAGENNLPLPRSRPHPAKNRLLQIGLEKYIRSGKLLIRSLNTPGQLWLNNKELLAAVPGSVIFLDTATRFLTGGDSDQEVIKRFVNEIFGLVDVAEAVVMVHHSPKEAHDEMSLENALRGCGDIGAMLSSCWATQMHTPNDHNSLSYFVNLKQRDFETIEFNCDCDKVTLRMTRVDSGTVVAAPRAKGFHGNRDGQDGEALQFLKDNPTLSSRDVESALAAKGIKRSCWWVQRQKAKLSGKAQPDTEKG